MLFFEILKESLVTLKSNKMRTLLSILGIVIGIGSMIGLMALGAGSQKSMVDKIQSLGSNLLTISPKGSDITLNDLKNINNNDFLSLIEKTSPEASKREQVVAGENNVNQNVTGILPDFLSVKNYEISLGETINQEDNDTLNRIAILGWQTATDLFEKPTLALNQKIKIKNLTFKVTGILKEKGSSGMKNQDEAIFIPLSVAQKLVFNSDELTSIAFSIKDEDKIEQAKSVIGYTLLEIHNIDSVDDADFRIFSQAEMLETMTSVMQTMTGLLAGIAAISLLVGGIGIMNIMLVTVTERTREIGLRKALGAKNKTITLQFMMESIIITTLGGLIGIIFGVGIATLISKLANLETVFTFNSIFLSVGISILIGLIFGIYPAQKAAKLQPIEALRYE
jgi:putative ABC transport system permease protein